MKPATLKTTRALTALVMTVLLPLLLINDERHRLANAKELASAGEKTTAELRDVTVERHRAYYIIPIDETYSIKYLFTAKASPIEGSAEISVRRLELYAPDKEHFRINSPFSLVYLPNNPGISMPETELTDSQKIRWSHLLFMVFALFFCAAAADMHLRRKYGPAAPKYKATMSDREIREAITARREMEAKRRTSRKAANNSEPVPGAATASTARTTFGRRQY